MTKGDIKTLLFSPMGRITRKTYIWTPLILSLVSWLLLKLVDLLGLDMLSALLSVFVGFVLLISGVMLSIKRFHDLEKSGWFTVLLLIPVVNFFVWVYMIFVPGTVGKNEFGEDPLK